MTTAAIKGSPMSIFTDDLDLNLSETRSWNEADMLDLLRQRYTRIRRGTNADRYVRAAHPRCPRPHAGGYTTAWVAAIADYIVIDTFAPTQIIGHEVKTSRADWLAELRNPGKSDAWRRYCHQWFLVCPDPSIVRDDLPDGWGLMSLDVHGRLRVRRASPVADQPEPMPTPMAAQLARAVAQTAAKEARS